MISKKKMHDPKKEINKYGLLLVPLTNMVLTKHLFEKWNRCKFIIGMFLMPFLFNNCIQYIVLTNQFHFIAFIYV